MRQLAIGLLSSVALIACDAGGGSSSSDATSAGEKPALETPNLVASPPAKDPEPPSTGREMPTAGGNVMTLEAAKEAINVAMAAMKEERPNCAQVVKLLTAALPVALPKLTKESVAVFQAMQKCAEKTKHWQTLLRASVALLPAGAKDAHPELVVRALVELGEYEKAGQAIADLGKKMPEARPMLTAARTYLICKQKAFAMCVKSADSALGHIKKKDRKLLSKEAVLNRILRAVAQVNLGEFDDARSEFKALQIALGKETPPFMTELEKVMAKAEIHELLIMAEAPPTVPLGIYHLLGKQATGVIADVVFVNLSKRARQFQVEVEIPGITEKLSQSVTLLAGKKREVARLVPPLRVDFDISTLRSETPAQVSVKVTEQSKSGDRVVSEENFKISVLPRDYLPTYRKLAADASKMTPENIAAWITPNDKSIDAFLAKAKLRHPKKMFVGEQGETIPQVAALFDELKSMGVTYVMDPTVNTDLGSTQRTRLPGEVLQSTNAQCLEGTILFATLMEAIGLRPIIVLVPGHAFVGWQTTKADGKMGGKPLFVETTMVGNAPFRAAVEVATTRVASELKAGNQERGVTHLLPLNELRLAGFKPQPR